MEGVGRQRERCSEDSQSKLGSYQTWVRTRHGWRHSGKHDRQPMPVTNMVLGGGFFFFLTDLRKESDQRISPSTLSLTVLKWKGEVKQELGMRTDRKPVPQVLSLSIRYSM